MKPRLNQSPEQWAILQLQEVLSDPQLPYDSLDSLDTVGIHAILTELHKAVAPYKSLPLGAIALDPINFRLDIRLTKDDRDTQELVRRFVAGVNNLSYAPSAWTLLIYLVDESIRFQAIELPDWRKVSAF